MIQNHKGGFDSAPGMSKSAREWPMGAKNGKILGRPSQKIKKKMKNGHFLAVKNRLEVLRPYISRIFSRSIHLDASRTSKPC